MISTSSKYALKAAIYLALHSNEEQKLMVKDFYEHVNVPKAYLAKLLQEMSRNKLVSSSRGPKGGFYMTAANKAQPVIRIVYLIDGQNRMESCLLGIEECREQEPCPLHKLVSTSRTRILKALGSKTVDDLARDLRDKKAFLPRT